MFPGEHVRSVDLERSNRIVSGFLERSGIAWLDLLPGLRAQADPTPRSALDSARDLHWRLDTHWTPRGNAVVAALVARQIVARRLLDSLRREPRAGRLVQLPGPASLGRGLAVHSTQSHRRNKGAVIRAFAGSLGGMAVAASAAAVAAWVPPGAAEKTPAFAVGLDVVEVTVTARDTQGTLVGDLRPEDFAVREDGREQEVLIFAPAARPELREELALNLGMLFDTSGSMRRNLRLSQESAVRFLDAIPRARDLLLVFFDRDIRLSRYSSENQQGIFERILGTQGGGQTALYDAIAVYLSRVADTPGRKVLIVFTDGDDTASRVGCEEVMRLLRASSVTVYPVEFPGEHGPGTAEALWAHSFLAGLADASGGRMFRPQASKELAAIYRSILEDLGSQYVIGYVSDNSARDGKFRRIALEVRRPGIKLRYRPGYQVAKNEAFSKRRK